METELRDALAYHVKQFGGSWLQQEVGYAWAQSMIDLFDQYGWSGPTLAQSGREREADVVGGQAPAQVLSNSVGDALNSEPSIKQTISGSNEQIRSVCKGKLHTESQKAKVSPQSNGHIADTSKMIDPVRDELVEALTWFFELSRAYNWPDLDKWKQLVQPLIAKARAVRS